jgi:AbrB family looped-hinge helix DNA binding protein
MTRTATMTSKGQITVPKAVREALGAGPGDRLAFHVRDDGSVTLEVEGVDLMGLRGSVTSEIRGVTVEDMHEVIRRSASGR